MSKEWASFSSANNNKIKNACHKFIEHIYVLWPFTFSSLLFLCARMAKNEILYPYCSYSDKSYDMTNKFHDAFRCENWRNSWLLFVNIFKILIYFLVSFIGIIGNIFNISVLVGNRRAATFTQSFSNLLIALSLFDLMYLVVGMFLFGFKAVFTAYETNIYPIVLPTV